MTRYNQITRYIALAAVAVALLGSVTSFTVSRNTCVRFNKRDTKIYNTLTRAKNDLLAIQNGTASKNQAGYDYYTSHPKELQKAIDKAEAERENYKPTKCGI
jgi:hypothetical protein